MKHTDFIISYPLINSVYHTVRNQFAKLDCLRKNVQAYKTQMESSEEEEEEIRQAC